ncbi:sentrin-specific protease 8-like [Antedon mediterranea]|uniref:sentrin-specific protease 8-like n=1 Tax=Antedon mediterranea TaxID=105859 RepID=UPI003AF59568
MAERDKIVLSYHDSLLRQSDLCLLQQGHWLNDNVLSFVFEYFEHEQFCSFMEKVAFISPQVTQFIKFASVDDLEVFLTPLDLKSKDFVLCFINNNQIRTEAGGSHWSVMLFHRELQQFLHYDSMCNMNAGVAKQVSTKLLPYIGVEEQTAFVNEECPQQQNSYDCGLFAITVAECLCNIHLLEEKKSVKEAVTQERVTKKREYIRNLLLKLSASQS